MSTIRDLRRILHQCRTIAVVGLSPQWHRPSHFAAKYMQAHGYRIVPVNPGAGEILGEPCHPSVTAAAESLAARGQRIDMVDCFRRPEDIPAIADGLSPEAGPLRVYNWNDYIAPQALEDFTKGARIIVGTDADATHITLWWVDDGRGIDPSALTGTGRRSMAARAQRLGVDQHTLHQGCRVAVGRPVPPVLPLPQESPCAHSPDAGEVAGYSGQARRWRTYHVGQEKPAPHQLGTQPLEPPDDGHQVGKAWQKLHEEATARGTPQFILHYPDLNP